MNKDGHDGFDSKNIVQDKMEEDDNKNFTKSKYQVSVK